MANIQSTQYANPDPGEAPAWAQLLSGLARGAAGQITMQQQQAMKQDEENRKTNAAIAAQWAGNGQLKPGPGPNPFSTGGMNYNVVDKPIDATSALSAIKLQAVMSQIAQMQNGGMSAPGQGGMGMSSGQPMAGGNGGSYNPSAAQALFNNKPGSQAPDKLMWKQTGVSEYGVPQTAQEANPDYATYQKDMEPLGDKSTNYAGALQGLRNIKDIATALGIKSNPKTGEVITHPKARELLNAANYYYRGMTADPVPFPGVQGMYRRGQMQKASDQASKDGVDINEAQQIATHFSNLVENILRAHTGASAQDKEHVREEARNLMGSYFESPTTWTQKLRQAEQYLTDTAKGLRPRTWQEDYHNGFTSDILGSAGTQYVKTGTFNGRKVGTTADGKTEYIDGQ